MSTPMPSLVLAALLYWAAVPAAAEEPGTAKATFSMYCYWTGEATLGRVPGVLASRIGDLGGREIVEVVYDPAKTDLGQLTAALKKQDSFYSLIVADKAGQSAATSHVAAGDVVVDPRPAHFIAPKHSLRTQHPELYYLDLDESQAIALNSWSYFGGPEPDVLTAEQKARRARLAKKLLSQRPGEALDPAAARTGDARVAYRQQLEEWLGE